MTGMASTDVAGRDRGDCLVEAGQGAAAPVAVKVRAHVDREEEAHGGTGGGGERRVCRAARRRMAAMARRKNGTAQRTRTPHHVVGQ
jgi:hypothetical protein